MYNKKVMFHYVDHTFFVFTHLCVCVCSISQLCLTLCNPMDSNSLGSAVLGIF